MSLLQLLLILSIQISYSWLPSTKFSLPIKSASSSISSKSYGAICGSNWDIASESYGCKVLGPTTSYDYMGDLELQPLEAETKKRKHSYNLNVGRALEGLRKELPLVFIANELDMSIFAPSIIVIDGGQRKVQISRGFYSGIVKSLRMAASFSSIYPSMNVRKIDYIDDCSSIQCLVDVVLPDAVRVDGQAVWSGMFYFGLNDEGLISSHVFDRKISKKSSQPLEAKLYPWMNGTPMWEPELIAAAPGVCCIDHIVNHDHQCQG